MSKDGGDSVLVLNVCVGVRAQHSVEKVPFVCVRAGSRQRTHSKPHAYHSLYERAIKNEKIDSNGGWARKGTLANGEIRWLAHSNENRERPIDEAARSFLQ